MSTRERRRRRLGTGFLSVLAAFALAASFARLVFLGNGPDGPQFRRFLELFDPIAELGGALELERLSRFEHLLFEHRDQFGPIELILRGADGIGCDPMGIDRSFEGAADGFANGFRRDAVLLIVLKLEGAPPVRLIHRPLHTARDLIGIQDHFGMDVAGRPPHGLNQRGLAAQKALLVGIEDGHQLSGTTRTLAQEYSNVRFWLDSDIFGGA